MDDLQDIGNLNPWGEIEPFNEQRGQKSQNGQNIHGQIGNNNIIYMADNRDMAIRDYVIWTPQAINPRIVRPEVQATNFELKLVMFQMLQIMGRFNGLPSKDPHIHLKHFLEINDLSKLLEHHRKHWDLDFSHLL